jgi:hypothetical protein
MRLLETVTGNLVDVSNPDPATISIEDIAWGLSRQPRFCGQTITETAYNTAQHSIFVAEEVEKMIKGTMSGWDDTALYALLHDAAEAYTGDWPSPVKHLPEVKPIIDEIERKLLLAIYQSLNLPGPTNQELDIIKKADRLAQKIEAFQFMPSRGKHWEGLPDVSLERLQQFTGPLDSLTSYKMFMANFSMLYGNQKRK